MNKVPTKTQVSAGGVVFYKRENQIDVAIISVVAQRNACPIGLVILLTNKLFLHLPIYIRNYLISLVHSSGLDPLNLSY